MSSHQWLRRAVCALVAASMIASVAHAQDTEINDTFATSQLVPGLTSPGTLVIPGGFLGNTPDVSIDAFLAPGGGLNAHDFAGLPPGRAYTAILSDPVPDPEPVDPDTVMHAVDDLGAEVAFNDDIDYPANLFSAFQSNVNADGTIHLEVTGYDDYDFTGGDHPETGSYNLFMRFGDTDFYKITNLEPGTPFEAVTATDDLDTILTWYDDDGAILGQNDDNPGGGLTSIIEGAVPVSGMLFLSVTGFPDFPVTGGHLQEGAYELQVSGEFVPEPSSYALAGLCLAGFALARSRRRKQSA